MMKTPVPRPGGPVTCQAPHSDVRLAPWTIEWLSFHHDREPPFQAHRLNLCHVHSACFLRDAAVRFRHLRITGVAGPFDEGLGQIGQALTDGFGNQSTGVW